MPNACSARRVHQARAADQGQRGGDGQQGRGDGDHQGGELAAAPTGGGRRRARGRARRPARRSRWPRRTGRRSDRWPGRSRPAGCWWSPTRERIAAGRAARPGSRCSRRAARNSSKASGSETRPDDRDQDEHERDRRQERVVGELARHLGDVVHDRALDGARHQLVQPRRSAGAGDRSAERTRDVGSSTVLIAPGYRPVRVRATRVAVGRAARLPLRRVGGASDHPSGGRRSAPPRHISPRGPLHCPPRGGSEARDARAQRFGLSGQRSLGNEVERRRGPQLLLRPPATGDIVGRRADRLRRIGPDGLGDDSQPRRGRARGAAVRAHPGARRGAAGHRGGVDGRGRRGRRPGVLVRHRLAGCAARGGGHAARADARSGAGGDEHHRPRGRAGAGRPLRGSRRRLPRLPGQRRPPGRGRRDARGDVRRRRGGARARDAGPRRDRRSRPPRPLRRRRPGAGGEAGQQHARRDHLRRDRRGAGHRVSARAWIPPWRARWSCRRRATRGSCATSSLECWPAITRPASPRSTC